MAETGACPICLEEGATGYTCASCGVRACSPRHLVAHRGGSSDHQGGCLPFRVEKEEERGRHFIATRDIKALELVLVDR